MWILSLEGAIAITSLVSCMIEMDRWVGGINSHFKSKFIQSDNKWSQELDDLKGCLI